MLTKERLDWLDEGVISAAIRWWEGKRPVDWDRARHLEQPKVNTTNEREELLAEAVAALIGELRL